MYKLIFCFSAKSKMQTLKSARKILIDKTIVFDYLEPFADGGFRSIKSSVREIKSKKLICAPDTRYVRSQAISTRL